MTSRFPRGLRLWACALALPLAASAAEAPHGTFRAASTAVHHDISPPLRDIPVRAPADTFGDFFGALMIDPDPPGKLTYGPQDRDGAQSMDQLRQVLFHDLPTVRISDYYTTPEMATDLLEHDLKKLDILFQRGRESFASREAQLRQYLL